MESNLPLVSILCSVFNGANYIVPCVNSCLKQSYPPIEMCIVDDGSTDSTWEVLHQHFGQEPRVKLYRFESNRGKVSGFNQAYKMASGEYFALIGADDLMPPERILHSLTYLQKNKKDLVYGKLLWCSQDAKPLNCTQNKVSAQSYRAISFEKVLSKNLISGGAMLFNTKLANAVFPIPEDLKYEDWWISFHALRFFSIGFIDEYVLYYIRHPHNTTGVQKTLMNPDEKLRYLHQRELTYYDHFSNLLEKAPQRIQKILQLNILSRNCYLERSFFKRLRYLPKLTKNLVWSPRVLIKTAEAFLIGDAHLKKRLRKLSA